MGVTGNLFLRSVSPNWTINSGPKGIILLFVFLVILFSVLFLGRNTVSSVSVVFGFNVIVLFGMRLGLFCLFSLITGVFVCCTLLLLLLLSGNLVTTNVRFCCLIFSKIVSARSPSSLSAVIMGPFVSLTCGCGLSPKTT